MSNTTVDTVVLHKASQYIEGLVKDAEAKHEGEPYRVLGSINVERDGFRITVAVRTEGNFVKSCNNIVSFLEVSSAVDPLDILKAHIDKCWKGAGN